MTIWLTSDEHYYHRNIIEYCNRPFANVEEMNRGLIDRHNSLVKPEDTVYHLGDFSFNENAIAGILEELNGHHHLVPGNHDKCFAAHKRNEAAKQRYLLYGFVSVSQNIHNFEGHFILSHMPYAGAGDNSHKERYPNSRLQDKGGWICHGHIHTKWKVNGRMINVGVDVWDLFPVALETLINIKETQNVIPL